MFLDTLVKWMNKDASKLVLDVATDNRRFSNCSTKGLKADVVGFRSFSTNAES